MSFFVLLDLHLTNQLMGHR